MRNFETCDLFKAVRLVKTSGVKEDLKPVLERVAAGEKDTIKVGVDVILTVICAFAEKGAESQLIELLSGPLEMKPNDVAHMDINDLAESIEKLWKEGNLKVFFEKLSKLITTN